METQIRKNGSLVLFGIFMIVTVLVAFIVGFNSIAHADEIKTASPAIGTSPAAAATGPPEIKRATPAAERTLDPSPKAADEPAAQPAHVAKTPEKDLDNSHQILINEVKRLKAERLAREQRERQRQQRERERPAGPGTDIGNREVDAERSRYPQSGGFFPVRCSS